MGAIGVQLEPAAWSHINQPAGSELNFDGTWTILWWYRRLFWEAGVLGQVLYLEA